MEQKKRKPPIIETDDQRAERANREVESRNAARREKDDNVQKMIERSIKDHGA